MHLTIPTIRTVRTIRTIRTILTIQMRHIIQTTQTFRTIQTINLIIKIDHSIIPTNGMLTIINGTINWTRINWIQINGTTGPINCQMIGIVTTIRIKLRRIIPIIPIMILIIPTWIRDIQVIPIFRAPCNQAIRATLILVKMEA